MKDNQFIRGSVPMTKEEVRAIILDKLQIDSNDTIIDIGAGTGSVAIEAAQKATMGKVVAIEHNDEAVELIQANCKKHNIDNIEIIHDRAPNGLECLPKANKIFIGGSGGNLNEILTLIDQKCSQRTIIVMSAIVVDTFIEGYRFFKNNDYNLEVIQVSINRVDPEKRVAMLIANNPIFIITAQKRVDEK